MSKKASKKQLIIHFVLSVLIIGMDQLSKYFTAHSGNGIVNDGGVFGLFPSRLWAWGLPLVLCWLFWEWWVEEQPLRWWGIGLLWAGGVSNWLDRFIYGGVFDFIYYPPFRFYGNIADIVLGLGVVLLVLGLFRKREDETNT